MRCWACLVVILLWGLVAVVPYDPAEPLVFRVELEIDGVMVDVTARARAVDKVRLSVGRSPGAIQPETSTLDVTLGNADGWLTEGNPLSPWYSHIGRGVRLRLSVLDILPDPAVLFDGRIVSLVADYPQGSDSRMRLTAIGLWGQIGLGDDPLRSALYRSMSGIAPGDYIPLEYWPMEDGSDASRFSSALPDGMSVFPTGVTFAADSTLISSSPLPTFSATGSAAFPVRAYTFTGSWWVQVALKIPTAPTFPAVPGTDTELIDVFTTGGAVARWRVFLNTFDTSLAALKVWGYNSAGVLIETMQGSLGSGGTLPAPSELWGQWAMLSLGENDYGPAVGEHSVYVGLATEATHNIIGGPDFVGRGGSISSVRVNGNPRLPSYGHLGIWVDPAFTDEEAVHNILALKAWDGEQAHERAERLCREQGLAISITGSTSTLMGPQRPATLPVLLAECELADQGLAGDGGIDGALTYVTRTALYRLEPEATIAAVSGDDLPTTWDYRHVRNLVVSSRPGGGSATAQDDEHIARTGATLRDTPIVNVATDDQLPGDAQWRLHKGLAPEPRYPAVPINMRNRAAAAQAEQVLTIRPGARLMIPESALPGTHPPGGIDGLIVGWTASMDAREWLWRPHVVPYSTYRDIGVYGAASAVSRYDSAHSTLVSGVDADDTTLLVHAALDHALWVTGSSAPTFPLDASCSGIRLPVSAIASAATDTFTRSVTNGWGTSDSGHAYAFTGGTIPDDYDVNGSAGTMTLTTANVSRRAVLDTGSANHYLRARVTVPVLPTGAGINVSLVLRFADMSNHYVAGLRIETTGAVTLLVERVVSGVFTTLTSATIAGWTHVAGASYHLAAEISGTTLRATAWRPTDAEPGWRYTTTDSSLSGHTSAGVRASRVTGNTNTDPVISWDDLSVPNPQRFTVTRLADGIDKPLPAGGQVRLWRPDRYAL